MRLELRNSSATPGGVKAAVVRGTCRMLAPCRPSSPARRATAFISEGSSSTTTACATRLGSRRRSGLTRRLWRESGGDPELVYEVALWGVPAGILGGRLYHDVASRNTVRRGTRERRAARTGRSWWPPWRERGSSPGFFGLDMREAVGTSLLVIAVLTVPTLATHSALGHIEWKAAGAFASGAVPASAASARLSRRITGATVRRAFGGCWSSADHGIPPCRA